MRTLAAEPPYGAYRMTASPPALRLRYLGGCPDRARPDTVDVTLHDGYFELRGHGWGWRIAFSSVVRVGEPQPAPDGDGQLLPIVWEPPGGERTLMLSGRDAGRLRFLLAQAVAAERLTTTRPPAPPAPTGRDAAGGGPGSPAPAVAGAPPARRLPSAWQRELRRLRLLTLVGMTVALAALVVVFGIALVVLGRGGGGHWAGDRALLERHMADIRVAEGRNDAGGLSQALQALVDECRRLEAYNGEPDNHGDDFAAAQRICATVGVTLF
jgi:hypothetical protein